MNKFSTFRLIPVVFLAVLAMTVGAGPLCAENHKGSFTLPFEVRWGTAVLPAGDYTFTIDTDKGPNLATIRGDNGAAMIIANGKSDRQFSGRSSLVLARRGRTGVVRELHLAIPGLKPAYSRQDVRVYDRGTLVSNVETQTPTEGGIVFTYSPPKGEPSMLAQTPELIQRIPILMASK